MARFRYSDEDNETVYRIVVWNWKTGEPVRFCDLSGHALLDLPQVFDLSSDESGMITSHTQAIFLDEFHMAVIPNSLAITELAVFNTLIPQGHSGYLKRLVLPLEFRNMCANIRFDRDRDFGSSNKDEALLPDPAQAVFVIEIWADEELRILLVVRTQTLVKQVHAVRTDFCVPWDEWRRDAVAIQVWNDPCNRLSAFVHDAQVMVMRKSSGLGYDVRTFDFSQRGRGSLPLRSEADGIESVPFEDGADLRFGLESSVGPREELQSLSDGSLIYLVSCLTRYVGSEVAG